MGELTELILIGLLATVPFTLKNMAVTRVNGQSMTSMRTYVQQQRNRLTGFYFFKKKYILVLIPLLSAIGGILVFNLYFPGGVLAFLAGAIVNYLLTLLSCYGAVKMRTGSTLSPLQELQSILDDYNN